ncbi:TonB-dependent receptor [Roseiterribacter gracilis]|uniref:Iron transport receptor protein n=1 Tax=Roseiterribacter gracilis TaxID=2812848 RepID=A0A8S8XFG2_9PROT|nr:iron transport receptor protein [Rhodospirillales bacterium TMPK1]
MTALLLGATQAWAQTAPVPSAKPDVLNLPTISVQGQGEAPTFKTDESASRKFTAPLLDTPKTVTVIPPEVIKQAATTTLQDALRTVPGITLGSGEGGTSMGDRPFIRGFESTNDFFIDGVRDGGTQSRDLFNIDSIEVTKGPGSAYTGRGSTGGSINLISKAPKLENFVQGSVQLGTDATHRGTADVNYVIADGVAARLNVMGHENEVAGRKEANGDRWGVAPSIAFGLGTPTRVTASYFHITLDELPDYGVPYNTQTLRVVKGHDDDFYGLVNRDFHHNEADIGTIKFEHDFGKLTLTNTTRYGRTENAYVVTNPDDSRGNAALGFVQRSPKSRDLATTTITNVTDLSGDFVTGSIKHHFIAGIELSNEKNHSQAFAVNSPGLTPTPGFPPQAASQIVAVALGCSTAAKLGAAFGYNCTTLSNPNPNDPWIGTVTRAIPYTDTTTDTRAAYAFDTIDLTDHWQLNLGARVDSYKTRAKGITATATATAPFFTTAILPEQKADNTFFNYQIGIVYKPTQNGSVYFSYGTSSNPAGEGAGEIGALSATVNNIAPEKNRSFEVGTKWDLFDNKLQLTGAIFRTEKTNARIADPLGGLAQLVGNQRVDGVELGIQGAITDKWKVFGGYTHLDSKIVDGGPLHVNEGKKFPNTPDDALSLWSSYDIIPAVTVGGGATYQSNRWADAANTRLVDSYWRFDAVAQYRFSQQLDFQINVQNLTDERYALRAFQTHMVQIAPGRSALFTANYKF